MSTVLSSRFARPRARARFQARTGARPFFLTVAIISVLVTVAWFTNDNNNHNNHNNHNNLDTPLLRRYASDEDVECRMVHKATDQCAFVLANCGDDEAGLLSYLTFYYCTMGGRLQPIAFVILVLWLALLFATIGIAASDFFSVNLGTIASILGLSESLAGVTFLAFGNGSPDVFSTFAAMGSNSGSMAVGELIGAAGFITAVVAGSMALVREFRVSRRTFVRDILFFIASVTFAVVLLADGHLRLWECLAMIGFYLFYVVTVVGWHWVSQSRKRRRQREAAARGDFFHGSGANDSLHDIHDELAPYHDDEEEESSGYVQDESNQGGGGGSGGDGTVGGRRARPPPDISALERGPRIEIDAVESPNPGIRLDGPSSAPNNNHLRLSDEDLEEARNRQISAEMANSMRVSVPPQRRRRGATAITPIRPSLLGALEFRSVLNSLQKSGTVRLAPLDTAHAARASRPRAHSRAYGHLPDGSRSAVLAPQRLAPYVDDEEALRSRSASVSPVAGIGGRSGGGGSGGGSGGGGVGGGSNSNNLLLVPGFPSGARDRALSSGDLPRHFADAPLLSFSESGASSTMDSGNTVSTPLVGEPPSETHLPSFGDFRFPAGESQLPQQQPPQQPPQLAIPTSPVSHASLHSSPSISPFPAIVTTEDPPSPQSSFTPEPPSRISSFGLPPPEIEVPPVTTTTTTTTTTTSSSHRRGPGFPDLDDDERAALPKPVHWWPYRLLPPPHVIQSTLFPTLQGWQEKTLWDRFVSLVSAPTVFLLVTTLPVVEMEAQDDDEEEEEDEEVEEEQMGVTDLAQYTDEDTGMAAPLASSSSPASANLGVPETEWQRYRRLSNASGGRRPRLTVDTTTSSSTQGDYDSVTAVSLHSATATPSGSDDGAAVAVVTNALAAPVKGGNPTVVVGETSTASSGSMSAGPNPTSLNITTPLVNPSSSSAMAAASTTSEVDLAATGGWNRWLVAVQLFTGPLFTVCIVWANMAEDMAHPMQTLTQLVLGSLAVSLAMLALLLMTTSSSQRPRYHSLLCFLGFVIAVAWISTVAGEVVGVLKAIGVIAGISEAILGLTVFAVGNSLGDLVADITVARLGFPVMALSACFGGPMLNILLGVGMGGAWMTIKAARDHEIRHPGTPRHYKPYQLDVGPTLLVSAVTVLLTLVVLLIAVPLNRWVLSRRIGMVLIGIWVVTTLVNVILEIVLE